MATKTLTQIARMTDDEARAYLESLIWPNGPVCPHCGSVETFRLNGESHLGRYCDEFSFRWDHRKVTDGQRTESAIEGMTGKRLMYKALVGKK
jgi:hypothetical protein